MIDETGGLDAKPVDLLRPENNTPMPATGVKALRFFKRETVIPTSNMLMPVEPNLTAFTQPCNLMGQVHNGSGTPSQTQGIAQEGSRLMNRQVFRISQEHYWRS